MTQNPPTTPTTAKQRRRTLAQDALNLPNLLTMGRIVAIPFFVWLLDLPTPVRGFWACILFTAAAITDVLDGYLARKLGVVSVLGKFLDPLADKLIVMAALVLGYPYHLSYAGLDLGVVDMVHVGRTLVYLSLLFSFASAAQYVRLFAAAVEAKEQKRDKLAGG